MALDMQQVITGTMTAPALPPPSDAAAASSSAAQSSTLPALPSLNPADSPYKPLDLPQVTPPNQVSKGMGDEQPIQNLGAVSKAGAAAYLASNVLRSAVQGYDAGRLQHAQKVNSQLQALGTLDKQVTDQFTSAYNDVASSKTGPNGKLLTRQQILGNPANPNDPLASDPQVAAVRKLYHQGEAIHSATLNTIQGYIPSLADADETGSPGKGKKQKKNLLERMFGGDPNEALQAYYQVSKQTGWRGGYAGYTDQQAQAAWQQRQQQGITGQTAVTAAQTGATTADTAASIAQINNKLTHAVASGAPQEEIDKLLKERDELMPTPKFPLAGLKRTGQGADGKWYEWQVDQEGGEIRDTRRPLSTAGLNPSEPKVGSFGDFMVAAYGPRPTPKQYIEGQKAWKQSQAGTTVGTHTVLVTQGDKQVPFTFTTTSTKSFGGAGGAGGSAGSSAGTMPDVRADGQTTTTPAAPRTMVIPNPKGLIEPGNLPIDNRPTVHNADGTHSSEYSVSFADDKGHEVLVPTVVNGKFLTPDGKKPPEGSAAEKAMFKAAWDHYLQTGQHLGKFDNPDDADAYANKLHSRGSARPSTSAGAAPKPATGSRAPQQSGAAIGYKDTPEYKGLVKQAIDAQKEYNGAFTNLSTMVKTADAAKKGDGAAQVGIISAYLKSVVGGQGTGVRITKAEWDAATGTRPLLKGIEAKFSPDGYMTGAAIAPSQVDQMTREVLAKTTALKETAKAAKQRMLTAQEDQVPDNLKPKPAPPSATGTYNWSAHPVAQ